MRTVRFLSALALAVLCAVSSIQPVHAQHAETETRALLVACSDFLTQQDLGAAISGNLHMIGSALLSADVGYGNLSFEDGTIGTPDALRHALENAFSEADGDDLSILYLCTHGVLSSADDGRAYLLLGDGEQENPLSADELFDMIRAIRGEKLLIIDACYSGALIGRSVSSSLSFTSPFLADSSIHVLASADGNESSWYYDSEQLASGAVSYFASALACGLGLYGTPEADMNGDGDVWLDELHQYLCMAVPSSSSQLLSSGSLSLPVAAGIISRPLLGFSYGSSLLSGEYLSFDFSFTVAKEHTSVQYRLVEFTDAGWDWDNARVFTDAGDNDDATLNPGRKMRTLTLDAVSQDESGYLMLQVFSVAGNELLLCSERLIAVQRDSSAELELTGSARLARPGHEEAALSIALDVPSEITVSVYDAEGTLIRRLAASQLTRPSRDHITTLYWDGRDAEGRIAADGRYTIAAEAIIGGVRRKASTNILVGSLHQRSGSRMLLTD